MIIDPDYLIERKYYKSQLKKWKILTLLLITAIVVLFIFRNRVGYSPSLATGDYIANIQIDDLIYDDIKLNNLLHQIKNDDKVKALILHIDSPGGTVAGSEKIYGILRSISNSKPVVAVLGTVAASGGYLVALAADYIIAQKSTVTGSIGIVHFSPEITEFGEKIGIKFHTFKSGELKAAPSLTEKVTPAVHEATMTLINDMYDFFVELVAERRQMSPEQVLKVADGKAYTGRQALSLNLIDALGTTEDALTWLQQEKKLSLDLRVIELHTQTKLDSYIELFQNNIRKLFFGSKINGVMALYC